MLKTITLTLTVTLFATLSSRAMHAQSIDPPAQTDIVTGGDPQPTGEPPKQKGQTATDSDALEILMALGLA